MEPIPAVGALTAVLEIITAFDQEIEKVRHR